MPPILHHSGSFQFARYLCPVLHVGRFHQPPPGLDFVGQTSERNGLAESKEFVREADPASSCARPVAYAVAVTLGMAAPLESVAVPKMMLVAVWANAPEFCANRRTNLERRQVTMPTCCHLRGL